MVNLETRTLRGRQYLNYLIPCLRTPRRTAAETARGTPISASNRSPEGKMGVSSSTIIVYFVNMSGEVLIDGLHVASEFVVSNIITYIFKYIFTGKR